MSEPPQAHRPTTGPVQYKGSDLEAERGPGLGCFRFQVVLLIVLVLLTPISVYAGAPDWLSAALLFLTIILLLFTGQTIIFLLRLVAADRRGRRRPLAGTTPTVGELEDAQAAGDGSPAEQPDDEASNFDPARASSLSGAASAPASPDVDPEA